MVSACDAKTHFPQLVSRYLEDKLDFPPFVYPNEMKNMTRSIRRFFERENISLGSKVTIMRNIGLEKVLLKTSSSRVIQRRLTTGASTSAAQITQRRNTTSDSGTQVRNTIHAPILQTAKKVPFGVRGRKRRTFMLQHIGIQNPNPDGRKLFVAGAQTNAEGRNVAVAGTSTAQTPPAVRPISRPQATSTPFVLNTIDESGTTLDSDTFDWSVMGRLCYSSSEE